MTYSTGSLPIFVTVNDVNGDKQLDIIVVNLNANNVEVLINTGTGTFNNQKTYPTGNLPKSVAVTDVNGDSKPDIIVANSGTNNVGVLFNTGSGTFLGQTIYPTDFRPSSVAAVDVNGDNKPDIILANSGSNNVGVLFNTGSGTFTVQTTYPTGPNSTPTSLVVVDVNGDSKPDIIVANYDTSNVGALFNTGNGTFSVQTTYPTGFSSNPISVVVVDVNGDTKPDIVVANYGGNSVGVLFQFR